MGGKGPVKTCRLPNLRALLCPALPGGGFDPAPESYSAPVMLAPYRRVTAGIR